MENQTNKKLVTYLGYYHLYRVVNDRHFLGFSDHRIGLSIIEVTEEIISGLKHSEFPTKAYTPKQITSFYNLSLEQLEEWVKRGN